MNPLIYVSAHPNKYSNSCPKNTKTEIKSPNGKFEYLIWSFAKSTHKVTVVRLDGWTSTLPKNCLKHFSYTFLDLTWMAFSTMDLDPENKKWLLLHLEWGLNAIPKTNVRGCDDDGQEDREQKRRRMGQGPKKWLENAINSTMFCI